MKCVIKQSSESEAKEFEYDNKLGAANIETYTSNEEGKEGKLIPYPADFMDYKMQVKMFYIQKGDADHMVVVKMIEELLVERHNGCVFYDHNLARFDSRFILAALDIMVGVSVRL